MAYNRRDLIGHWICKTQPEQRMCTHACCRGKRVHPANMPVILPSRLLRRASDDDLAEHYRRVSRDDSPDDEVARAQVLYEMDRRDRVNAARREQEERRAEAELRRRDRWSANKAADRMEREALAESAYVVAEYETRGNMLNKRGRAAGISDRSLFTGPESRARAYASEELLEHWRTHPRPTAAMFAGRDTRVYELYTAPPRWAPRRRAA